MRWKIFDTATAVVADVPWLEREFVEWKIKKKKRFEYLWRNDYGPIYPFFWIPRVLR